MIDKTFDVACSIGEIRGLIKSLLVDGEWIASNGDRVRVREQRVLDIPFVSPRGIPISEMEKYLDPGRASFVVSSHGETAYAIIEAFDIVGKVRLRFRDGYVPIRYPNEQILAIGEAFGEFAEVIIEEIQAPPIEIGADDKPWEKISNIGYDRKMLRLWYNGYQASEIGRTLGKEGKTILNRLCTLRKIYGPEIVPYKKA